MKAKVVFLSIFLVTTTVIFSQNKNAPKSIIASNSLIKKFHGLDELKALKKGDLINLYSERVQVLIKTLPYMAVATKSGTTLSDLGVQNSAESRKIIEMQEEATSDFLKITANFQKNILPYADKDALIASILFYESTMKSFYELNNL